jgi:hypothetical protein
MMTRTIMVMLTCSVISPAQPSATTVPGTYHFNTPQTAQSLQEAATIVRTVASVPQVSVDIPTATLTFSGPAAGVNFAEWVLPQIDRAVGDEAVHEYLLPSGDIGRVNFVPNLQRPQDLQELLTILRTVADVQKIFTLSSNHAIILLGPDWQVAFAEWVIGQLDQPIQQKPDVSPHEFTVGGPDYRGMGHGARLNFLSNMTSPQQGQELLTVLRTVGDIMKVFSYSTGHALVLRAGDSDLQRAEWLIQQLDLPPGQASGPASFTAAGGDDATRIFRLRNTTPQWLQTAVTGMRTELNIRKIFPTTVPASIVVRGTTDQIAAAMTWMTAHNALVE